MTTGATRRGILACLPGVVASRADARGWLVTEAHGAEAAQVRSFNPRSFGAAGNGTGDDTAAFRAMHQAMRRLQDAEDAAQLRDAQRPPLELVVQLVSGHYRYTWNRWTWGLRRITVLGYGALIQCVHGGPYAIDQAPLTSNRDHYWAWDPTGPAYGKPSLAPAEDYGWRIRTAQPGDEAVTLLAAADARLLRPGAWVLIQSYAQQQDGYPPNMRYFERARVASLVGNLVRLDRPLGQLHRDDWPEDPAHPAAIGRARLVAIDRPDCPLALSQSFIGLTILSNPNHAVRDPDVLATQEVLGIAGTLRAHVQKCTLLALGVSQAGEVLVEDTTFGYTEPDKLVDRLTLRNCTIGGIQACTGLNQVVLQGCTIKASAQLLAREVTVEGCTFLRQGVPGYVTPTINLDGPTPTRRMTVTSCRFLGAGDGVRSPISGETWIRVPIDGREVRLLDERRVEALPGVGFARLAAVLEEGWPVAVIGAGPLRFGRCSDITGRGRGAVFTFALPIPLRTGDTLSVPRLLDLTVQGGKFFDPFVEYPSIPNLTWEDEVTRSRLLRLALRSDFASRPAWLPGFPRRVRCTVTQPYRGPQSTCFLTLREEPPHAGGLELLIDLRVPGEREVSRSESRLSTGDFYRIDGNAGQRLPDARYIERAHALIVVRHDAVPAPALGTEAEQASILLEVEVDNPFA